ncbi:unnamed protein product, partial [Prunus brigantina]
LNELKLCIYRLQIRPPMCGSSCFAAAHALPPCVAALSTWLNSCPCFASM